MSEDKPAMIYPVPEHVEAGSNKYTLVITAAKRARQIANGADPFVPSHSSNPLTTAFEELAQSMVIAIQTPEPEVVPVIEPENHLASVASVISPQIDEADDATVQDLYHDDDDLEEAGDLESQLVRSLMGADTLEDGSDTDEDLDGLTIVDPESDETEEPIENEPGL